MPSCKLNLTVETGSHSMEETLFARGRRSVVYLMSEILEHVAKMLLLKGSLRFG